MRVGSNGRELVKISDEWTKRSATDENSLRKTRSRRPKYRKHKAMMSFTSKKSEEISDFKWTIKDCDCKTKGRVRRGKVTYLPIQPPSTGFESFPWTVPCLWRTLELERKTTTSLRWSCNDSVDMLDRKKCRWKLRILWQVRVFCLNKKGEMSIARDLLTDGRRITKRVKLERW
jgi:hypothetical protein